MTTFMSAQAPIAAQTVDVTGAASYAWLLILIPLVSAGLLLLAGRSADKWGHLLATLASWSTFVIGAAIAAQMWGSPEDARRYAQTLFTWIPAGDLTVTFGLLTDPLSITFVLLVTFVGSLIHVYAIAYMEHDEARRRFFAYLNFFIAAMLTLVLADSYVGLFAGWEGVGLASYLLIGFWNHVPANAVAAKKAFVMNRVGDMGMLIAMMAMVASFHSVSFADVSAQASTIPVASATFIGFFLLVAACGKSAQFPLQAWLGDAMAGPTPVSALIHAATMVTAGVYLIVRSGAIFVAAPVASTTVAIVGAITLLFGAIVGCAKDDMKKVLAASTMSQIGYMMLGAGLGPIGWAFAIFHLFTHGFFKALMFLGAGSVMHGMGDQVNMRRFGALRGAMKVTWLTFMMGWLAILGVPPFAGYWSKDKIIEAAFSAHTFATTEATWIGWVYGTVALVGAGVTAFYMSRLFFMTFHGKARWTTEAEGAPVHPHESGPLMTIPMIILAIGAVVLGGALSVGDAFVTWLAPSIGQLEHGHPVMNEYVIQGATLALVIVGALIAWMKYGRDEVPTSVPAGNALTEAARRALYQDPVNETLFMMPAKGLVTVATVGDASAIDGALNGLGGGSQLLGRLVGVTQNGLVRTYAAYILGGVILALAIVLGFRL